MKTLGNSDNTFIWLRMNLCDVALDAFLWFDEFIAPCYLLQLSYCGCFLSWYHIPISLITPTESHHPPTPTYTPDLSSHPSGPCHQTLHRPKNTAFHLQRSTWKTISVVLLISGQGPFLVFRPPAMKQLLSVRGSSRPLVTPQREPLSFIPVPLKAVVHSAGHHNALTSVL